MYTQKLKVMQNRVCSTMVREIHPTETGAYGRTDGDNPRGYWSPDPPRLTFGQAADTRQAEAIQGAIATEQGDDIWLADRQAERRIQAAESILPREAPAEGDDSYSLEMAERMRGEQAELLRQRRTALRAHEAGHNREAASTADVTARPTHYSQTTPDEAPATRERPADPWPELPREELATVNRGAARLADYFGHDLHLDRATLSRLIAQRILAGADPTAAVVDTKEALEAVDHVPTPLGRIDPYGDYEATVEAEVTVTYTPKDASQAQVGRLADDSGGAKFVIWARSGRKPTLRVGDRVRIERAKVDAYHHDAGVDTTLAVVGHTSITHLARGDGPDRRQGRLGDDPRMAPWDADSDPHAWVNRRPTPDGDGEADPERTAILNAHIRGDISMAEMDARLDALDE